MAHYRQPAVENFGGGRELFAVEPAQHFPAPALLDPGPAGILQERGGGEAVEEFGVLLFGNLTNRERSGPRWWLMVVHVCQW